MIFPALFLIKEGIISYSDLNSMSMGELRQLAEFFMKFRKEMEVE